LQPRENQFVARLEGPDLAQNPLTMKLTEKENVFFILTKPKSM